MVSSLVYYKKDIETIFDLKRIYNICVANFIINCITWHLEDFKSIQVKRIGRSIMSF